MDQRGFTLIELIVVAAIIGILAIIAIPRFRDTRDRAIIATMQSDLNFVRNAQETFYQTNNLSYADDIADLIAADLYIASAGVTVVINTGNGSTWDATATHTSTAVSCDYDAAVGVIDCS